MYKYTILYKNGKTWSGKTVFYRDIPPVAGAIMVTTPLNVTGYQQRMVYAAHKGFRNELFWQGVHIWNIEKKQRTPNPNSKTKKQKKFDEDYRDWVFDQYQAARFRSHPLPLKEQTIDTSIKAYKKWLWEQKQLDQASQFKVSLFNTDITHELVVEDDNQRKIIFTDPFGNTSCVKFEKPKAVDLKVDIGIYAKLQEEVLSLQEGNDSFIVINCRITEEPIKTTYTFWLGAGGEVVDE
jgi:hypothetical protein